MIVCLESLEIPGLNEDFDLPSTILAIPFDPSTSRLGQTF